MFMSVFPFPCVRIKKPRLGYQSGLFESGGSLGFLPGCLPRYSFDEDPMGGPGSG